MIEYLSGREYLSLSDYLFAVLAGVTGVAGSYAVAGYTRRFIVAPIDALVVRMTPGELVTFVIQNVGEVGHLLHISLSFVVATGLLAATAILGLYTVRRFNRPVIGVGLAGVLAWILTASIAAEPLLAVGAAGPVTVWTAIGATSLATPDHDPSRRRALASSASALAFIGVSFGLGRWTRGSDTVNSGTEEIDDEVFALM